MTETYLHGVRVLDVDSGPRPIRSVNSAVIGLVGTAPDADATAFPLNQPVLIAGSRAEAAKLDTVGDGEGTLPAALDAIFDQIGAPVVVVRVAEGEDIDETMLNVIGGVNSTTGDYEGVHALAGAKSKLGYQPRILCAPGFTHQRTDLAANGVVSELLGIADKLRAVILVDGLNTTDAAAIAAREDWGSKRVFLVDPWVKTSTGATEPASARVAGLIAKTDYERGFWWSPSNQNINGIVGTGRPVDFTLNDPATRANYLNENEVCTIVREDGYRLWGNRTCSSDAKWAFLSVVRTADMIADSLVEAHLWAVDRNITRTYIEDVTESVNNYLRRLTALGAILGGKCWPDPDLNTADALAAGKVYFNFDFTPPAPAEQITFRSMMVNDYYSEVV